MILPSRAGLTGGSNTTNQGNTDRLHCVRHVDRHHRPQTVSEGGRKLSTGLTGAAERPGPGDPDGSGTASVTVNPGQGRICYQLAVSNIATAAAAHIHIGAPDAPGPVRVTLAPPADGDSAGCVDVSRALALDILKEPGDYYINVHNADFPAGAIRGQLAKR